MADFTSTPFTRQFKADCDALALRLAEKAARHGEGQICPVMKDFCGDGMCLRTGCRLRNEQGALP